MGPGTSGSGEGRGQRGVGDRGVADDIIRQRQEDEQSNVITEKYSRLRIKSVGQNLIKACVYSTSLGTVLIKFTVIWLQESAGVQ